MGPTQRPPKQDSVQGAGPSCCSPRPRRRLCLLKGCEQPFEPSHPQARYCSADCRTAARRWRRWHACRTYRASEEGQARRCQQSRRYRERLRDQRSEPPGPASGEAGEPREGQRPAWIPQESCCARPGCYERFMRCCRSPLQIFCGWLCRKALRRVRQREARWRRRLDKPKDIFPNGPPSTRGSPIR